LIALVALASKLSGQLAWTLRQAIVFQDLATMAGFVLTGRRAYSFVLLAACFVVYISRFFFLVNVVSRSIPDVDADAHSSGRAEEG
jgi:hypothetical protein